eukprot:gene17436-biopygen21878
MGPEVGPAFQRRSGRTLSSSLGVRLAETVEVGQYKKRKAQIRHSDRGITYKIIIFASFRRSHFFVQNSSKWPPPAASHAALLTAARARAGPANDMGGTREESSFPLLLERLPPISILSVRLAGTMCCCRRQESFVADSQGVPDDVRGLPGGGGYVASQTLVKEQHHTIAGAMMWCGN